MINEKTKSRLLLSFSTFLFFASLSSVIPFLVPIALKYSSTTPSKIGFLNTFLPLLTFASKPLFCSITDKFKCRKLSVLIFIQLCTFGFGLLLVLPFGNFSKFSNWIIYCLGLIIAFPSSGVVTSLLDIMIIQHSSKYSHTYGSIRLWGTVGWGSFCLSVGAFDQAQSFIPSYIFGIFIFIFLMTINTAVIGLFYNDQNENFLKQTQHGFGNDRETTKSNIIQQVILVFKIYPSLNQFALLTIVIGIVTQFHWVFYPIYLHSISNHDSLLISLSIFFQSLGEIQMFLFADRILKVCLPAQAFNITLLAIVFRYISYTFINNPEHAYYVLFVELSQSFTFGFFICQITSLAQKYASKAFNNKIIHGSIQATMQGVFGACFEGFGLGLGAFISGSMIESLGVLGIWKLGAAIAIITFCINNVCEFIKCQFSRKNFQNHFFENLKTPNCNTFSIHYQQQNQENKF